MLGDMKIHCVPDVPASQFMERVSDRPHYGDEERRGGEEAEAISRRTQQGDSG
jgi:hypothetical protein